MTPAINYIAARPVLLMILPFAVMALVGAMEVPA